MTNEDLDRLRAVSKELAEAIENKSGYGAVVLSEEEAESIAADILRLAEKNERLKKSIEDYVAFKKDLRAGKFD